jgi:hypothetical protein
MDVHRASPGLSPIFIARKRRGFSRLPSLRWHYPDQVNGFDLSRAL